MNTSEVLNRAADLIEERGWGKGAGWFPVVGEMTPVCTEGAIKLAATDELGLRFGIKTRAYDALVAYLDDRFPECINPIRGSVIPFSWNDRPGRTQAEVIEVLRAAAAIEQAREAQPAEVSA